MISLGVDAHQIGTYCSEGRPGGSLFGEGQGVIVTPDGQMATWKGQGVGKLQADGSVNYRGAIFYSTESPKLARLNTVAVVFEFEVDAKGNTSSKAWEWK